MSSATQIANACCLILLCLLPAFGFAQSPGARKLPLHVLEKLGQFAYREASARGEATQQYWRNFKNTIDGEPVTVDLLNALEVSQTLKRLPRFKRALSGPPHPDPTVYEELVLSLRAGDTVRFGNDQYTLGEFLGAGNASHVFAIAGNPRAVIRIPFLSRGGDGRVYVERMVDGRRFLRGVRKVRIRKVGQDFSFLIVDRVDAEIDGLTYLHGVLKKYGARAGGPKEWPWIPPGFRDRIEDPEDLRKYDELIPFLGLRGVHPRVRPRKAVPPEGGISMIGGRQVVLDRKSGNWILVDWE